MKAYWESDGVTLYHGDCREVLAALPAESVQCIVTSPPYNVGLKGASWQDNLSDEDFAEFNRQWLEVLVPIMAESARLYVVVSDKLLFTLRPMAEMAGLAFGQLLAWCKPNLSGGSGVTGDWSYLTEYILLFRKGKRTPMLDSFGAANTHSFFVIPSPQSNWTREPKEHPAQFPVALCRRLLSRTPGEVVLDPFMGSGSVGVAAIGLGRKFIGTDTDESYCEIAKRRIVKAQGQLMLTFDVSQLTLEGE